MKRITLLLVMLCISFSLMANRNQSGKDANRLVHLLPDKVTQDNVKNLYGEATIVTINKQTSEESWQYKGDAEELFVRWDTKTGNLKSLTYRTHAKPTQKWSNKYLASIEMDASTPNEVADIIGTPSAIFTSSSATEITLRYINVANTADFVFKKGVLANIRIYDNEKKPDVSVLIEN